MYGEEREKKKIDQVAITTDDDGGKSGKKTNTDGCIVVTPADRRDTTSKHCLWLPESMRVQGL